jgi:hypothetical protein
MDKNVKPKGPKRKTGIGSAPDAKKPSAQVDAQACEASATMAGNNTNEIETPRLVHRNGVAYVEGCDVPVWRMEMARRAGSGAAALAAAVPGLTATGLELAFAYAQRYRAKLDKLIRQNGGVSVPAGDEGADDAVAFEADLDTLLEKNAEVFRRLAL